MQLQSNSYIFSMSGKKVENISLRNTSQNISKHPKSGINYAQSKTYMGMEIQDKRTKSSRSVSFGAAQLQLCFICQTYIIAARIQKHIQLCKKNRQEGQKNKNKLKINYVDKSLSRSRTRSEQKIRKISLTKNNINKQFESKKKLSLKKQQNANKKKQLDQKTKNTIVNQDRCKVQEKINMELIQALHHQKMNSTKWKGNSATTSVSYNLFSQRDKVNSKNKKCRLSLKINELFLQTQNGYKKVKKSTIPEKQLLEITSNVRQWIKQKSGSLNKYGSNLILFQSQIGNIPQSQKKLKPVFQVPTKPVTEQKYKQLKSCGICLNEFQNKQLIKNLPCQHKFHAGCINVWLYKAKTCPICRHDIYQ